MHGPGDVDHLDDLCRCDDRLEVEERGTHSVRVEDLEFLRPGGVSDGHSHHEAIQLGLREGIGALVLQRVLGGNDDEGRRQRTGDAIAGDLALRHRFEQCSLGLRARPVDLVPHDDVGEDGSLFEDELGRLPIPDRDSSDIRGQEVGGELDAIERAVDRSCHRLGEQRLPDARHIFDQNVTFGEQAQQHQFDGLAFALDDTLDVRCDRIETRGELVDLIGRRCVHAWNLSLYDARKCTPGQKMSPG